MANIKLDAKTIDEIKTKAWQKLSEHSKTNDIIGGQIFSILELENKVLYYPIDDDGVWGFSEKRGEKSFVWINTSIPYDKQVFAAAHELFHLWFENNGELILREDIEETGNSASVTEKELKANRFAGEFLMGENLLLQEMRTHGIDRKKIDTKDILRLSNLFVVPYNKMAKRLFEIRLITKNKYAQLKDLSDKDVAIWRNRLGLSLPRRDNKIGLSNLVDMALELYEAKKITNEKLEYILGLAGLSFKDVGIEEEEPYIPPTEEELDAIMGE